MLPSMLKRFSFVPLILSVICLSANAQIGPKQCQSLFSTNPSLVLSLQQSAFKINSADKFLEFLTQLSQTDLTPEQIAQDFLMNTSFIKKLKLPVSDLIQTAEAIKKSSFQNQDELIQLIYKKSAQLSFFIMDDLNTYSNAHFNLWNKQLPVIKVRNQKETGSCWIHALIESLEIRLSQKLNKPISLSVDYSYQMSLVMRAAIAVQNPKFSINDATDNSDGLYDQAALTVLLKYGIVPASAYNIKKSPIKNNQKNIKVLSDFIWHERANSEYSNLNDLEKLNLAEKKFLTYASSINWGDTIESFEFNKKKYTPLSFLNEFFPELSQKPITTIQLPQIKYGYKNKLELLNKFKQLEHLAPDWVNKSVEQKIIDQTPNQSLKFIKEKIDQGEAVYFVFRRLNESYFSTNLPGEMSKASHAMLITGYFLDSKGEIAMLKIQNSYGSDFGNNGFQHLPTNYYLQNTFWLSTYGL